MAERIGLERVRELLDQGAQLVDVLSQKEYEDERLPGAVNVPLKELEARTTAGLDRGRPLIVYCHDGL
jgi:rhodanese-related sulfurtransferase